MTKLTQSLKQETVLTQQLSEFYGETGGEIPVYSLHRIKSLLRKWPIPVSRELFDLLVRALIAQNAVYREESGNDWSCLTSNNLVAAIEAVDEALGQIVELAAQVPSEHKEAAGRVAQRLQAKRSESVQIVKDWFQEHYDDLLYAMDGKIPWAIVKRLRRFLSTWIAGAGNPFLVDVEELILEVAAEEGVSATNPEDAWVAMGGKLNKKE